MEHPTQSPRPPRSARHRRRGYTLLAILLILAALTLIGFASLQYAMSERRNSVAVRDDAFALTIAEAGLERTMAYLDALNGSGVDLDVALDPKLDTECILAGTILNLGLGQADDNLPVFNGTTELIPPANRRWRKVPHQGGAYFVRIEDNDDDVQLGYLASTSNNLGAFATCVEGPPIRNPIRDRDRTVVVHVLGIYPGDDLSRARARKSLRVTVGPFKSAGIVAGGKIEFVSGASHVCGAYGDTMATGDVEGGCFCGSGCNGGPPYQSCGAGNACNVQAGGACNGVGFGGGGGTCTGGIPLPAPPMAFPWDVTNAPMGCAAAPCTPFYYLRDTGVAELWMWNYAQTLGGSVPNCNSPRAWSRICRPGDPVLTDCASCWTHIAAATVGGTDIVLHDAPGLSNMTPAPNYGPPAPPLIWRSDNATGTVPGPGGCNTDAAYPYPGPNGSKWGSDSKPAVQFDFMADGTAAPKVLLPRGIWLVEGNIETQTRTPDCTDPALYPGWRASIIATGDIVHQSNMLALRPASPKGFIVLAGRDFEMRTGNTFLVGCGSTALMVHEQIKLGSNNHLTSQVVVENASSCSSLASGPAIELHGNATIEVSEVPAISAGRNTNMLTWAESTY